MSGHEKDEFTRNLSAKTCARLNTLSLVKKPLVSRRQPRRLKRMRRPRFWLSASDGSGIGREW